MAESEVKSFSRMGQEGRHAFEEEYPGLSVSL